MTTADILWMNIPLAMLFFALWVGIPMWMIYRHPDRHPRETRTLPAYLRQRTPARAGAERRELVGAGRSR
jgi:hypothetical protein